MPPAEISQILSEYAWWQWTLIVGVMTLGSVVQGTVGFASGLIGVPLLVLLGVPLPHAAATNFLLTAMQNMVGAWRLRDQLTLRETVLPVVARWVGIPAGAMMLSVAAGVDQAVVKQLIGGMLLAMVVVLWTWRPRHRDSIPTPVTLVAFLLSGFLLGFAAIGGAPMVLYVNSLNWSAAKSRAFLFFASATGVPLMAMMLAWNFGRELAPACVAALIAMPFCWLGVQLGIRLGMRLDKQRFRQLTYTLLTVIAVSSLLAPWLRW